MRFEIDNKSVAFHRILRRLHQVNLRHRRIMAKLLRRNSIDGSVCLHRKCSVFRNCGNQKMSLALSSLPMKLSVHEKTVAQVSVVAHAKWSLTQVLLYIYVYMT